MDFKEYRENLDENIRDLVDRLKGKKYRAKLVKRKYDKQMELFASSKLSDYAAGGLGDVVYKLYLPSISSQHLSDS